MSDLETQQIEKLKLTWKEINYSIRAKRSKEQKKAEQTTETYYEKCIVDSAEGYWDEGQALFIMGSSGAGKTTLLNILADRIGRPRGSKIERNVKINGEVELNKNNFGAIAAYVMQDDHLFESFTWEQAISFAAKLRLNHRNNEIKDIVDKIIDDLGLKDWRKTKIGGITYKGLSGGERKRTSIAIEIVTNPKILFLDEPTSGLDSFTAKRIVELLIKYSKQNRIVITTIHQPNSDIFILFDRLLLLMEGKTIYQGDAKSSVEYFKNLEFYVPEFWNPTDYYLKEFYVPFIKTEEDILKSEILVRSYNNEILPIIQENMNTDGYYHISNKEIELMMVKTNWWKEFLILWHRLLINIIQHPKLLKFKILAFLILSLVSLSLFFDLKNDEEGVRSKIGSMLFIWNVFTYGPSGSVIVQFSNNRPVLAREYASRTYGLLSYLISSSLMNFIQLILN